MFKSSSTWTEDTKRHDTTFPTPPPPFVLQRGPTTREQKSLQSLMRIESGQGWINYLNVAVYNFVPTMYYYFFTLISISYYTTTKLKS